MTSASPQLNPLALTVEQAARVLSAAGPKPVTPDMLRDDIDDGAPTNADGTLNLVDFTAWLIVEMNRRAD
jgi:hypothetical protein